MPILIIVHLPSVWVGGCNRPDSCESVNVRFLFDVIWILNVFASESKQDAEGIGWDYDQG